MRGLSWSMLMMACLIACQASGAKADDRFSRSLQAQYQNQSAPIRSFGSSRDPQQAITPPHTPPNDGSYFSIYYGPLYEEYDQPCYWDDYYGQWIGPCDAALDTPGFSRTIPNRISR